MASRTTPTDVSLTFQSATNIPNISGGFLTGSANQYQVWSDRAIWDTTNNKYLYPGVDFSPYLMFGD